MGQTFHWELNPVRKRDLPKVALLDRAFDVEENGTAEDRKVGESGHSRSITVKWPR